MCGIAGIVGSNSGKIAVEQLIARIGHRGPDGKGVWKNNDVALGHVRLSIIDLSDNAAQPMEDPASGNVLVFNGEIYNYIELKKQLSGKYSFRTGSDTEVVLACYSVYGEKFLTMLRGMFALALYDRSKNKVLFARDRMGIKPFYYRQNNGCLMFASEIKALVNCGESEEIEEARLWEFIANLQLDCDHRTFFKGVYQLSPASYTWCAADGSMESPVNFWNFPSLGSRKFDNGTVEELKQQFSETVALHLRSDVPVGSFLSGGLDSTSVACFALKEMHQSQLHTFSGVLPYFHPENSLIEGVVKGDRRIVPHQFLLDGKGFFDDIPRVIYHHDEPILDGSMYAHFKLCQLASAEGIKVLLSGSGGDELFGGYSSYVYAHLAKQIRRGNLARIVSQIKLLHGTTGLSYQNLLAKGLQDCMPFALRRKLKNKKLRTQYPFVDTDHEVRQYYFEHADPYYANLINNFRSWTTPPYLHYEDRNSMAFGVEIRVPFYDHRLIEFVLQFEDSSIIQGSSKSVMRTAFKGLVPDPVLTQKGKYGFPSPIDHALKNDAKGRELFFDLYASTPFLKKKETEAFGKAFYEGKVKVDAFWRTLSYILWYQLYFKEGWKQFNPIK